MTRASSRALLTAVLALASTAGGALATPPEGAADLSLTLEDYALNGVPDLEQPWSAPDYGKASRALREISRAGPERLPRVESDSSGAVFARMTDPSNLGKLRDPARPVNVRAAECTLLLGALGRTLELYVDTPQLSFGVERAEITGFALSASPLCLDLLADFLEELPAEDPSRPDRASGVESIRKVIYELVLFMGGWMRDRDEYGAPARLRIVRHLRRALPELAPRVPRHVLVDLDEKLKAASVTEPDPQVRAALDRAISELEAALG